MYVLYNRIYRYETMIMKRWDSCRFLWRDIPKLVANLHLNWGCYIQLQGWLQEEFNTWQSGSGQGPLTLTPRHTLLPFSDSFPYSSSHLTFLLSFVSPAVAFSTHSLSDHLGCPGGFVPWLSCVWSLNHVIYNLPACLLNLLPDHLMILYPPFIVRFACLDYTPGLDPCLPCDSTFLQLP